MSVVSSFGSSVILAGGPITEEAIPFAGTEQN